MARQVGVVLGVAILVTVLGTLGTPIGDLTAFRRATVVIALIAAIAGTGSLLLVRVRVRALSAIRHVTEQALAPRAETGHRAGPG